MLRIRSEHAIGFLKGRFPSLKNLRINITDEPSHIFATYWIAACIGLHSFAMQCEEDENPDRDSTTDPEMRDPFIDEGLSDDEGDDDGVVTVHAPVDRLKKIVEYQVNYYSG
jgi:hypothetical protein